MKALYDETRPGFVVLRTPPERQSDPRRNMLQERVLQVQQHPEVIGDTDRSERAWRFNVARNINHPPEPHRTGPR
jgi:RNA polymerase sigma-70 factor (ECF subfamily)